VKETTEPFFLPSIIVTFEPPELFTAIALPMKLMFSKYVPGATSMGGRGPCPEVRFAELERTRNWM
jgi:hypothetical protein